jgi:hypothetical protein
VTKLEHPLPSGSFKPVLTNISETTVPSLLVMSQRRLSNSTNFQLNLVPSPVLPTPNTRGLTVAVIGTYTVPNPSSPVWQLKPTLTHTLCSSTPSFSNPSLLCPTCSLLACGLVSLTFSLKILSQSVAGVAYTASNKLFVSCPCEVSSSPAPSSAMRATGIKT